jgi:hypothetical protein
MASAAEAQRFVDDLEARTRAAFERRELAFRRELEGPDAPELAPWDVAFYAERLRFDTEMLRRSSDRRIFELASGSSNVRFARPGGARVARRLQAPRRRRSWLATVYVDPYPRDGKRDGAWMPFSPRQKPDRRHAAVLVANLTPPVGGKPALLTHREVETIFHEFGHLLHHLLSRVEVRIARGHERGVGLRRAALADHGELVLGARGARSLRPPLRDRRDPFRTLFEKMKRRAPSARQRADAAARLRALDLALHRDYDAGARRRSGGYTRAILQEFSPRRCPRTTP